MHDRQDRGACRLDAVVVADADHQLDAADRIGREVDDRRRRDQAVGQHDDLVVAAAQPGLEDADRFDLAALAADVDDVADAERLERHQHHARGHVR
ncbi:hypothetical protein D3C85_1674610 [compost metagenome]